MPTRGWAWKSERGGPTARIGRPPGPGVPDGPVHPVVARRRARARPEEAKPEEVRALAAGRAPAGPDRAMPAPRGPQHPDRPCGAAAPDGRSHAPGVRRGRHLPGATHRLVDRVDAARAPLGQTAAVAPAGEPAGPMELPQAPAALPANAPTGRVRGGIRRPAHAKPHGIRGQGGPALRGAGSRDAARTPSGGRTRAGSADRPSGAGRSSAGSPRTGGTGGRTGGGTWEPRRLFGQVPVGCWAAPGKCRRRSTRFAHASLRRSPRRAGRIRATGSALDRSRSWPGRARRIRAIGLAAAPLRSRGSRVPHRRATARAFHARRRARTVRGSSRR